MTPRRSWSHCCTKALQHTAEHLFTSKVDTVLESNGSGAVIHSNFPGGDGCTESQAEANYHIHVLPRRAPLNQHQHCQAALPHAEAVLPPAAALVLRCCLSQSSPAHFHMQKHLQERLLQVRASKSSSSISSSTWIS